MQDLIKDFVVNKISIPNLAKKYNLSRFEVKDKLKENLKAEEYKKISRSIGGFTVSRKLKDPEYRKRFVSKISKNIKKSVLEKMKNKEYYNKWLIKAKEGSIKGHKKVKELLEKDESFRERWVENCRKGGFSSYKNGSGIYNPNNFDKRKFGSLLGLKRTARKINGPKGEKMYNKLERDVAKILLLNNFDYIYEKTFDSGNINGHISCDFIVSKDNKTILIEATNWDKVDKKCNELNKKFKIFDKLYQENIKIVVNLTSAIRDKYKKYLNEEIKVFSLKDFDEFLKKISSSGRWI